ncbi:MAG: hypothetical protein WA160_05885 [Pseudobdellovibrio sp.]
MLLFVPFVIQGAVMFFDEFYFHRKRGLPLWERIGHPIDSFSVFLCYFFIYLRPANEENLYIYVGLCAFSCLLITKDEFVHTQQCEAKENWLHSILFVLHPITFLAAGIIWKENLNTDFLKIQPLVILIFMVYQILYWSSHGKSK